MHLYHYYLFMFVFLVLFLRGRSRSPPLSFAMASAEPTNVQWLPCISVPPAASEAALTALEAAFNFPFPSSYRSLLSAHQGQLPYQVLLPCQNINTQKWLTSELGPLYHTESASGLESDQLSLSHVNAQFLLTSSAGPRLPLLAFSEDNKGRFFCIDTASLAILLVDSTGATGPWAVAENFADFLSRVSAAAGQSKEEIEENKEYEETGEELEEEEENGDDEMAGSEDGFLCDICMEEISECRYHCETCANFDLCAACHGAGKQTKTHKNTHKCNMITIGK